MDIKEGMKEGKEGGHLPSRGRRPERMFKMTPATVKSTGGRESPNGAPPPNKPCNKPPKLSKPP